MIAFPYQHIVKQATKHIVIPFQDARLDSITRHQILLYILR